MRSSLLRSLVALMACSPFALAAQQGPRPIALAEAIRMAQQNSPAAVQALGGVRNGRAAVVGSLAQFAPQLSISAGVSKFNGATYFQGNLVPLTGDPWSQGRGYRASLILFDGGQRWFTYRAAQTSLDASHESRRAQAFAVALSVKHQYFAALAAQESHAAAQRQLEQAGRQLEASTARVRIGAVARTDSLRSAILVGNARIAILHAQTALDDANAALTRLTGSPFDLTAIAADTGAVPRIDVDRDAFTAMLADGPGIRTAEAQFTASQMSRRAVKTSYLPAIGGSYGFNTGRTSREFNWGDGPGSRSSLFSIGANFTILDGYRREQQLVAATVAADVAAALLRDAKAAARQSLAQSYNAFRNGEESVRLQLLQVAVAAEDLDAQQQRYAAGAASLVDLLTAQTTVANARAALISARLMVRTAKAQLEGVLGVELP